MFYRNSYKQHPLRGFGSPDGLGAYLHTAYVQPISRAGGGASTVAAYQPINGLGCGCAGVGADAPTPTDWVRTGLMLAGFAGMAWLIFSENSPLSMPAMR